MIGVLNCRVSNIRKMAMQKSFVARGLLAPTSSLPGARQRTLEFNAAASERDFLNVL